ncbi:olfactory receptor 11L1-like [Ambystoma mexicanum]|uniref:olfactory receptor 11L1-like n=1 Tax=Ambystoma mexicanum TaxID=8296 RepID=UPI0037E8FF1F
MAMVDKACLGNITGVTEFQLLGFQTRPELKPFLFTVFLTIYILTVIGNILIIVVVSADSHLHSPMYFFLVNLSFVEVWYTTAIAPLMLSGLLTEGSPISFSGCISQFHISAFLVTTECFLLTVMAYDRYVAICRPLHYVVLMGQQLCLQLAFAAWMTGFLSTAITSLFLCMLQFDRLSLIDHFFCDFGSLIKAACSDTSLVEMEVFVISSLITSVSLLVIIASYIHIISDILKIPSSQGRHRAFSTCSSHLAVVVTYFGTLISIYVVPAKGQALNLNKALSPLYTAATPLFNPIVYTLRNKDVQKSLRTFSLRRTSMLKN